MVNRINGEVKSALTASQRAIKTWQMLRSLPTLLKTKKIKICLLLNFYNILAVLQKSGDLQPYRALPLTVRYLHSQNIRESAIFMQQLNSFTYFKHSVLSVCFCMLFKRCFNILQSFWGVAHTTKIMNVLHFLITQFNTCCQV